MSHAMWKREYSRKHRLTPLLMMLWFFCITRPSTPKILIIEDNQALVVEKYWYILATFLWLLKLEWLGHIFIKVNYILSLSSLKYQFGWYLLGAKDSQYCRYCCAGALSSIPNTDQDQIAPLWVSLLRLFFLIYSMDQQWIDWIWLTKHVKGHGMWQMHTCDCYLGWWLCKVLHCLQFIFQTQAADVKDQIKQSVRSLTWPTQPKWGSWNVALKTQKEKISCHLFSFPIKMLMFMQSIICADYHDNWYRE